MKKLYFVFVLVLIPGISSGNAKTIGTFWNVTGSALETLGEGISHPVNQEHPQTKTQQEHPQEKEQPKEAEHPAAAEHPEHPAEAETPEHPASEQPAPTIEAVADYLEGYVGEKAAEEGGWMKIQDKKSNTTLKLKLDKIHRERLAKTDEGTFFVCADFKTPEGKVYDLDFWVKDTEEGLTVTETTIHKEEGKPRYTWMEKDGVWSRKPLEGN